MKRSWIAASAAWMALAATAAMAGPTWQIDEDSSMSLSFLGQVHYSYLPGASDLEDSEDFLLRRGRIILSGQIMDGVKFFAETDNDNAGKSGKTGDQPVSTDLQDMFVDVRMGPSDHWLKAGLILLPFSFESRASAASLLGNDYNVEAIKLVNTHTWRDIGAEAHGNVGKIFSYAAGVFDGFDGNASDKFRKGPNAGPRLTGHVALNVIGEAETGWFYTQNRFAKAPYLSLGGGLDTQQRATWSTCTNRYDILARDSDAWVLDAQSGFALGPDLSLTVNAGIYGWDSALFTGHTGFLESGLLFRKAMLTGKYSQVRPLYGAAAVTEDYTAGLHYFLKGHQARAGVEYRWGTSPDLALLGLQFLL